MERLFISHSTLDLEAVQNFREFLILGMGISSSDIFLTSQGGTLPFGHPFNAQIRNALRGCEKVLCFLTPNYLNSKYCLAELGAAWVQDDKLIPLLVPPLTLSSLDSTPLQGLQVSLQSNTESLTALYDQLRKCGIAHQAHTTEFNRYLSKYLATLSQDSLAVPDGNGYYQVKISAVRYASSSYRCYKLEKNLKLPETVNVLPDETHWLFFRAGMYEDLTPGDTIRLLVGSTELRNFPDLKHARNIYPDDLHVIR